ncbi:tetratricopeptide repeat protein [Erythrobacter sp. HL-111]|uniref:tetratricopeptide repeat protein n=1 Tax=Erythrobacter sp. HL-111 TaxID=1798193 RepID=UPI0006DA796A|nr:SEL1-like repeat protein [Erythrobacter sp. HL-111]KPP94048.1 MAG: TPR repeat protein SEL1 subfamily [Erythrobacteraceae bacterium HL-111]SDS59549.1 TPR repeat [Erythrobacter sp. HL-111]
MSRRLLALFAALLLFPAGEALAQSKELGNGRKAYERQRYAQARALYLKACEKRSGEACFELADMEERGLGGPQDVKAAAEHFTKACDFHYYAGCTRGGFLLMGEGPARGVLPVQNEKALSLSFFGCRFGSRSSCSNLAHQYANGIGTAVDGVKAREAAYKSCSLGFAGGCNSYGYWLGTGFGGPVDKGGAYLYLDKACKGGEQKGCENIANLFPDGAPGAGQAAGSAGQLARGIQSFNSKLYADAYSILRPFAEQGEARAEYTVGWMLAFGQGTNRDYLDAARFLVSAARKGDRESLAVLQRIAPKVREAEFVYMIDSVGPDMSTLSSFAYEVEVYCRFGGRNCATWKQRYRQAENANNRRAFTEQMARAWTTQAQPRAGFGNDPRRGGETFGACIRRQARTRGVTAGSTVLDFDCY